MADNLSISIGADTSKARHEMELLNAEMRKTQKEIKATADAAAKGDTTALTKLKAQTAAYDAMAKQLVVLKKEVTGANTELKKLHAAEHKHGFYLVENSLQSLNGALMAVGHNLGGAKAGIVGFAAGIVGSKILDHIDEVSKALSELKKTAGEIGIRPVALQAAQQVVKQAGHDADNATKLLQGLGNIIEENRQKFGQPVGAAGLPPVLSGGTLDTPTPGRIGMPGGPTVRVGRGGVPGLTDPTKALDDLDLRLFEKNTAGIEKAARTVQQRVLELQKTMNSLDFNIFAKAKFGMSGQALGETVNDLGKLEDVIKKLQGIDPDAFKRNDALLASQAKLAQSFEDATAKMTATATQARIFINNELAQFFNDTSFSANLADAAQKWSAFWQDLLTTAAKAGAEIRQAITSAGSALSGALSSAGQAIGAAAEQGALVPFARGGYVRGPGSGTSDSIMARLSAGEFVVNAARVRQLGLGFMQQLNGFAEGGLVGRFPRFAEGGLVGAADGQAVASFHFESGSAYRLTGPRDVVGALITEAKAQQMRSAGVKPSWFAGRPNS